MDKNDLLHDLLMIEDDCQEVAAGSRGRKGRTQLKTQLYAAGDTELN